MKQLGILDSAFINLEQGNTPQHIGALGIYDQSTAPEGFVRFKQVIANFEERLNRLPIFRTRLQEVPGGIDRPYWVEDTHFDLEFHVRHLALPKPGDWRQLCILVARLHARPLDMTRPLWEAYIIEGLDNVEGIPEKSFAVYTKIHHSLVDGAGGQDFVAAFHDLEPEPKFRVDEPYTIEVSPPPTTPMLLGKAMINRTRNYFNMPGDLWSVGKSMAKMGVDVVRDRVPKPDITAPRTRFNRPVGRYRAVEGVQSELADYKLIKDTFGVKLNDVTLAVIGGAMQRYLEALDEAPEGAMAAAIPVNMRAKRESTENNQVGSVFCSMHSDIKDPVARLKAVNESANEAKEFGAASPMVDAMKVAGYFSPWLTKSAARWYSSAHLSSRLPVNVSTVITNVPGPPIDLYCAGSKLVGYYGLGLLTPGCGLFHAVYTVGRHLTITILADRDHLEQPDLYRRLLAESLEELKAAAISEQKKAERKGKSVGKKPTPKKAAPKKAVAKKVAAKKVAAKKAVANKTAVKKPKAKKAPAKTAAKSTSGSD